MFHTTSRQDFHLFQCWVTSNRFSSPLFVLPNPILPLMIHTYLNLTYFCFSQDKFFYLRANRLSSFHSDLQKATTSLRKLMSPKVDWIWTPALEQEFEKSKELLLKTTSLQPNPKIATAVLTDASRLHGVGFAICNMTILLPWRNVCSTSFSSALVLSQVHKGTIPRLNLSGWPYNMHSENWSSTSKAYRHLMYGQVTGPLSGSSIRLYTYLPTSESRGWEKR